MHLAFEALKGEAVLHLDGERAAERVQSEHGISGDQVQALDRGFRDQIPMDRIAERLVDAHPVLVDGERLRCADDRRGVETAKLDIRLKRVALDIGQRDARDPALQRAGEIRNAFAVDITVR